jgi:hypothetical protein
MWQNFDGVSITYALYFFSWLFVIPYSFQALAEFILYPMIPLAGAHAVRLWLYLLSTTCWPWSLESQLHYNIRPVFSFNPLSARMIILLVLRILINCLCNCRQKMNRHCSPASSYTIWLKPDSLEKFRPMKIYIWKTWFGVLLVHTLPRTNCTSVYSWISLLSCLVHVMHLLMHAYFNWSHQTDHIWNCCTARMIHVTYVAFCNSQFYVPFYTIFFMVWCWPVWQHIICGTYNHCNWKSCLPDFLCMPISYVSQLKASC